MKVPTRSQSAGDNVNSVMESVVERSAQAAHLVSQKVQFQETVSVAGTFRRAEHDIRPDHPGNRSSGREIPKLLRLGLH